MKKNFLLLSLLIFGLVFSPQLVFAVSCSDKPADNLDQGQLETFWNDVSTACLAQISSNQTEQNTLKQAISSLNAKINLAQAQINRTISQIKILEKEVTVLGGVLDTVNRSMDDLSVIYLARVRESYRRSRVTPFDMIFSNSSFGDFLTKLKYLNTIKIKDQLILSELENSRLNYDQRKQEKVAKQQEVEKLKSKLVSQKKVLDGQIKEKQNLLTLTQNDEKKYQQLLSDAKTQLAALRRYVTSQGGASILSNQTKCDDWGCYYNQRDSQWGNMGLGGSSYSVAEYGCLVNSVAMMASHLGKNIKPGDIASNTSAFVPGTGYLLHSLTAGGANISLTSVSKDKLDQELSAGRSVIVGLYGGPDHFIVMVKKEGDKYIMHDPFLENGNNRDFSEKYNLSDINSLRIVNFN